MDLSNLKKEAYKWALTIFFPTVLFMSFNQTLKHIVFQITSKLQARCFIMNRNSCLEVFCRKGVVRNFAKFTGKHLCQSLFFIKVASACNLIKKETLAQVFSCAFCEISKNTFFTEHFQWLLLYEDRCYIKMILWSEYYYRKMVESFTPFINHALNILFALFIWSDSLSLFDQVLLLDYFPTQPSPQLSKWLSSPLFA